MAGDSRKEFMLTTTGNYFGLSASDPALANLQDVDPLNSFLDDGDTPIMAAKMEVKDGKTRVRFHKKVINF